MKRNHHDPHDPQVPHEPHGQHEAPEPHEYPEAARTYDPYEDAPAQVNQPPAEEEGRGLPLRGLAMVFIAIAIILALWGIYAVMSGSDEDKGSTPSSAPAASAPADASAPAQGEKPTSSDSASPAPSESSQESPAPSEKPSEAPAPAPAPEGPVRLNVLNNSTVSGLAKDVSGTLKDRGFDPGEVGNLPGEQLQLGRTTVFFQGGNADLERRAHELADQIGGADVRPFDEALPGNVRAADALTLVLVERPAL
ncbi:LytR C-terminal domain-containing protein [Corynebacterium uropygiale]|uniref:LytR C-terminal domain-containing protein n=1 Tax=Corynebacterium uropygiale TaxID=1775911 RepID=A0A9X1QS93_9CORY|nr:LytR C-terminal domain-containing protein [Corynebacterium uropygiale]